MNSLAGYTKSTSAMRQINWYAILFALLPSALLLYRASQFILPRIRFLLKFISYPLIVPREYWSSVTLAEAFLFLVYLLTNGLGLGPFPASREDFALRTGSLAAVNLIPLFLGGRTNPLASLLNIPVHSYYLVHHWVGRTAILLALAHFFLVISLKGPPRVHQTVSGSITLVPLISIFFSSLFLARRANFELFLKAHFVQAAILAVALSWHLLSQKLSWLWFPILILALWGSNLMYRKYGFMYTNQKIARICSVWHDRQITKLNVLVPWKVTRPGQYFYLSFPELSFRERKQAHPFMAAWWTETDAGTNLTFLIETQKGITARLANGARLGSVNLEGPYGHKLPVERYDNVILVANGVGIAGVLPYARFLGERNFRDEEVKAVAKTEKLENPAPLYRDQTRKIDLFWKLDYNDQDQWVSDYIDQLERWHKRSLFMVWLCYPEPSMEAQPAQENDDEEQNFRKFYPNSKKRYNESFDKEIIKEARRSPGKSIVIACGENTFVKRMRNAVVKNISQDNVIEFVEVEYRPGSQSAHSQVERQPYTPPWVSAFQYPRITSTDKPKVNNAQIPADRSPNAISHIQNESVTAEARSEETSQNMVLITPKIQEVPRGIVTINKSMVTTNRAVSTAGVLQGLPEPFQAPTMAHNPRIRQVQSTDHNDSRVEARSEKKMLGIIAKQRGNRQDENSNLQPDVKGLRYSALHPLKPGGSNLKISVIAKLNGDLIGVSNLA